MESSNLPKQKKRRKETHMPENSFLFEKVIPWLLVFMTVITVGLIVFAAGILLGFIQF